MYMYQWLLTSLRDSVKHTLRIQQLIQQGRPSSFVSKFVLNILNREMWPINQIASANNSSLIDRYLEEWLDV